jgi:elongation factor P
MWEPHFRPDERLEELELERQTMEFLYSDDENCVFMNPTTFDQVEMPRSAIGPAEKFLQPAMRVPVELFDGRPVSIVLPDVAELRITDTAPAMHAQQDSTLKEATLENGMKIRVPLFVDNGEIIRVDVRTGKYLERVREKKKTA